MAKMVFILGAGASRHAGAPLMNEFLERAWGILADGNLGTAEQQDFALVRKGVNALQLAHSKGDLDIWNLEAVFDAFEMAALVEQLGDLSKDEVRRLPEAMRNVILSTLIQEVHVNVEGAGNGAYLAAPTWPYKQFVGGIEKTKQVSGSYPAVITFNYDICLEFALHAAKLPWTDCLDRSAEESGARILKLHGSLNWAVCETCGTVARSQSIEEISGATSEEAQGAGMNGQGRVRLAISAGAPVTLECKCEEQSLARWAVMLVPPTINKGHHHRRLRDVWAAAALELRTAEEIIVCGYSLPETDQFFRHLYSVGSIGEASLRRFWVLDTNPEVKGRFMQLLGRQLLSQPHRFQVRKLRFEDVDWGAVVRTDYDHLPPPV